jgi:hypothetical protein
MDTLHAPKTRCNTDLFGNLIENQARYPLAPGHKASATSKEAAQRIAVKAGTLRQAVLVEYQRAHPAGLTADEAALRLEQSVLAIRPRVTELKAASLIERTPERRLNTSGMYAHIWRASPRALANGVTT